MTTSQRALRSDGEATYSRILESAGQLFASAGFAETSNKMIASHANVDLASINYHFGNRTGLYRATLVEAHRRLISIETLERITSSNTPAKKKLKELIGIIVESSIGNHGWHAAVLSREVLSPTSNLEVLHTHETPKKLPFVLRIISEITKIPVNDPRLLYCLVSIVAPCAILLVAGPGVSPLTAELHRTPRAQLVDHLYSFAIGGLEAITRAAHGSSPGLVSSPVSSERHRNTKPQ